MITSTLFPPAGKHLLLAVTTAAALLLLPITGARADCPALIRSFEQATKATSIDAVRRAAGDIASDIVCGERGGEFKGKYVDWLLVLAATPQTNAEDAKRALGLAEETVLVTGTWRSAAALGDTYFRLGDRGQAFAWYEKSLSFMTSRPATPASHAERQALLDKAGAAKSGADGGPKKNEWQQSTRELDGRVGGIYAPGLLREVEVLSVPLPVRFVTDEARFTPDGEKAVGELAQAISEQNLPSIKLVGHADARGSAPHNLDLSKRRVEAVRSELQRRNVKARIDVEWRGSTQPFDLSVLPVRPSQDEGWALDRRVEWVRDGAGN